MRLSIVTPSENRFFGDPHDAIDYYFASVVLPGIFLMDIKLYYARLRLQTSNEFKRSIKTRHSSASIRNLYQVFGLHQFSGIQLY